MNVGAITCPEAFFTALTAVEVMNGTLSLVLWFPGKPLDSISPKDYAFSGTLPAGLVGQCTSNLFPGRTITYGARDTDESWTWTMATSAIDLPTIVYGIAWMA